MRNGVFCQQSERAELDMIDFTH